MEEFNRFLRLVQATRAMPQTGYVLSGVKKADLSDLAQHHYLVTITGWYLANLVKQNKGKINVERVLEICLIHDLGELFGGDISMPYAKVNPSANKLAKDFERENQIYITSFLTDLNQVKELFQETNEFASVESVVAKMADYIEVTHFKQYLGRLTEGDIEMVCRKLLVHIAKIKDRQTKAYLKKFISNWAKNIMEDGGQELFEVAKTS